MAAMVGSGEAVIFGQPSREGKRERFQSTHNRGLIRWRKREIEMTFGRDTDELLASKRANLLLIKVQKIYGRESTRSPAFENQRRLEQNPRRNKGLEESGSVTAERFQTAVDSYRIFHQKAQIPPEFRKLSVKVLGGGR